MGTIFANWFGETIAFAHRHMRVGLAGVGLGMVAIAGLVGFNLLSTLVRG